LRVFIDKALTQGLRPVAARGPHHRWEGLVFVWPSVKGKQKWPSPGGGRGKPSLPYEQKPIGLLTCGRSQRGCSLRTRRDAKEMGDALR
jgi:hypothetical protein